jgi:predicted DNA-binding protein (MmcQ/YjbR family)
MSAAPGRALRSSITAWCRVQPGVTEERPFSPDVAVFKVAGKMFAAVPDTRASISLKCDPGFAEQLRLEHAEITAGYHLNKRHWNTVQLDGALDFQLVQELVEHSYTLVVDSLPRSVREELRPSSGEEPPSSTTRRRTTS